jgi:hypothetical protein
MVLLDSRRNERKMSGTPTSRDLYMQSLHRLYSHSPPAGQFALDETGPVSTNLLRNIGGLSCFLVFNFLYKRNAVQHSGLSQPPLPHSSHPRRIRRSSAGHVQPDAAFTLAPVGIVTTITQITRFSAPFRPFHTA